MSKKSKIAKSVNSVTNSRVDSIAVRKLTNDVNEKYDWQTETLILDKYLVDESFYDHVKEQFQEIYPFLMIEDVFSPMELVGERFWFNLTPWGKRAAILCLKDYAMFNSSPLLDVTDEGSELSCFMLV